MSDAFVNGVWVTREEQFVEGGEVGRCWWTDDAMREEKQSEEQLFV